MLRAGDILFRKSPFHHTMMVTDPGEFASGDWYKSAAKLEIVHAATIDTHVYREVIDLVVLDPDQHFTGYRANDPNISRIATDYALAWAWKRVDSGKKLTTKKVQQGKTSYSYKNPKNEEGGIARSRYYGVQEQRATGGCPAFEYDALFRAVKWASAGRKPFSRNRGTTCCAFITACHQAAVIDHLAAGDWRKVAKALAFLKEARAPKREDRWSEYVELGSKNQKVALGARRSVNPGPLYPEFSTDAYFQEVAFFLCGRRLPMAQVVPSALLVDAKFNYSANFEKMLATSQSGYHRLF